MAIEYNFSEDYNKGITGSHDKAIGKLMTPLKMHIQGESDRLEKNNVNKILNFLYYLGKSNGFADTVSIEDTLGLMQPVPAGNGPSNSRTNETGEKTIYNCPYMIETYVTRQLIDDSRGRLSDNIKNRGSMLPSSYFKTRLKLAVSALTDAAFGTKKYTFTSNGTQNVIDLTTYDGKPLFDKGHTYGKGSDHVKGGAGDTQSNLYYYTLGADESITSGLLEELIDTLANKLSNMKDENGDAMGYTADQIILPGNRPTLIRCAKKAVGTDRVPGSDHNDINVSFGNYDVASMVDWQSSTDDIILQSSECNQSCLGKVFLDRHVLDVKSWIDNHTRNLILNGYSRWGLGFNTYKHAIRLRILANGATAPSDYATSL